MRRATLPSVLLTVLMLALALAPAAFADYGVVRQFGGPGAGNAQFDNPIGVGVGPDGHVFVTDAKNDRVQELLPDGTFVRAYGHTGTGRGELRLPEDALSDGTSLFVTDCYNSRVTRYSLATGAFVDAWGSVHRNDPTFFCPEALAMSGDGRLFVADTFNQRVVAFDPHATTPVFASFGTKGTGPGQFTQVHGIEVAKDGNLLVGDDDPYTCNASRIQRFSPTGQYLGAFGSFQSGTGPGQMFCVNDIDQDVAGNVFVSDSAARVYAFAADGTFLRQVNAPGQIGFSLGLDSNASCELFAVDRANARVVVFGWGDQPPCRPLTPVAPPVVPPPPDTQPPKVVASSALLTPFGGPLRVTVRCPLEACTVAVAFTARIGGRTVRLVGATAKLAKAERKAFRLKLGRRTTARVRRHLKTHRSLAVTIGVRATDAAGNRTDRTLRTTIKRQS